MSNSGREIPVPGLLKNSSPHERDELLDWIQRWADKASDSYEEKVSSMFDRTLKRVGMTAETLGLLHLLAAKSGDSQQAVLEKALTFYGISLDAREIGNHIAILNDEDEIVREIKGFEPANQVAEPVAH